jgi:hypothetical protein
LPWGREFYPGGARKGGWERDETGWKEDQPVFEAGGTGFEGIKGAEIFFGRDFFIPNLE